MHGALHCHRGTAPEADASLRLTHRAFAEVLAGVVDMADALGSGAITVDGDAGALVELFAFLDEPDYTFNIVTP